MLLTFVVSIIIGILTMILRYSLWRKEYSQLMPGRRPRFFDILGDLKELAIYDNSPNKYFWQTNFFNVIRRRTQEFGKLQLFCLWITFFPFVCIVKKGAVKELMEKKIIEKNFTYKWMEPVLGTGLLTSEVSKWKPRRKLLMPCFHSDILRGFVPVFNEYSQKFVEFLQKETKKEFTYIETPVTLLTLDIICETMFGVKTGDSENDIPQFVKSFRRVNELFAVRMFQVWLWPNCLFKLSKDGKETMHHVKVVHDFTRNIIQQKLKRYSRDQRDQGNRKRKALLDFLLDRHMEEGELSEEDIREEVNTFASAGHETVSISIVWALYLIGLYKDVQTKIHEELDKVIGKDTTREVLEKDLNDLEYLDCVLKEASRLYPAAPWFGRKFPKDTPSNICGHVIPKGTACVVLTYFLHRDEEVFLDPEKFDPGRFSAENCHKIPEYAYIPFAAGPRNCIGQRFAMMEIKIIMSSILRNFSIESLDTRDIVKPFLYVTLHPSVPVRIRIRPRMFQKQH
ncbi:unnamed protein product [Larinioides sclopetarius]|uniref:Cytochrome P450 n=1 Tax=Larinioides sclopetarius TaxID=280406 RepID=A0AAV2BF98_9ARAC